MPRFAELTTCYSARNVTEGNLTRVVEQARVCPTPLRVHPAYSTNYILVAQLLGMAALPFAILITLNLRLYRVVKVRSG